MCHPSTLPSFHIANVLPQQKNANPRSGAHFFVAVEAEHGMRTAPQNAFIRSSVLTLPKEGHMVRAARVGARLFAARNECLEEVEDDCDDKEYERHGVPSEAGVFPVFDVMSARLMSKKRSATQKIRIWMILLFSGGGHRDNAAAEDHLLSGAGISRPSIFWASKNVDNADTLPYRQGKHFCSSGNRRRRA